MSYISASDITDKITTGFSTSIGLLITRSDSEMNNLVREYGLESTDIETSPLDYVIKQWLISWVMVTFLIEQFGVNNVDIPDTEKYLVKYKMYLDRMGQYRDQITPAMIMGDVENATDMAPFSGELLRG